MLRNRILAIVIVVGLGQGVEGRAQFPMIPLVPVQCVPPGFVPEPCDPPIPIVRLRMRVPACGKPDQELRYRIFVDNCSPAPAYEVVVRDILPPNCKFVRAEPEPERIANELHWKLGTLCGGCCREITLVLAPLNAEDVKNCARVRFEHGQCVTTHLAAAPAPGTMPRPGTEPPKGTTEPPIRPPAVEPKKDGHPATPPPPPFPVPLEKKKAGLTLQVSGPAKEIVEQPVRYTLTVTNPGDAAASNLGVTADLPAQLKFENASDGGAFVDGKVAWVLPSLPAGQSRTFTLQVRAKAAGELCVLGEAEANDSVSGKLLPRARDQVCTQFHGDVGLTVEMVDRTDPIEVGGSTSYPIRVRNQGQVPATNLRIRAFIPPGMQFVRAAGAMNHQVQEQRGPGGALVVDFDALPSLPGGQEASYEVFVQTLREGDWRFGVQMTADSLTSGPVTEWESTIVFREDPIPARPRDGGL